jgi:hypothetical protein
MSKNIDECLFIYKTKLIKQAIDHKHDINDILQHYYQSNSIDISYLIYCLHCPFEITLEYILIDNSSETVNIVGNLDELCQKR